MDIIISSEMNIQGFVPPGYSNMRAEFCWAKALNAMFYPIKNILNIQAQVVIFILPKKTRQFDTTPQEYKKLYPNSLVCVMQEGPIDLFTDWSTEEQLTYLNTLKKVDVNFIHNLSDGKYLQGLIGTNKCIQQLPTLYDDEIVDNITSNKKRNGVMISGNFSSWYGGMYAYQLVKDLNMPIYIPCSGRVRQEEKDYYHKLGITLIPWVDWSAWMKILNGIKLGINLMPTRAAGTFSLNCSALGIPCIGFDDLDAQFFTQPELSVSKGNMQLTTECIESIFKQNEFGSMAKKRAKKFSISAKRQELQDLIKNLYETQK